MNSDPLLRPFELRHLTLKNRIMSTAHEPSYAVDGFPQLQYQLYHEEKAKGGLALTMFGGSTNVSVDSPAVFGNLHAGSDDIIPHFQALADRVHRHGAFTMCQLTHMGRRTLWDVGNWLPTVSPTSVREPAHRSFPKELEEHDIRRIVLDFGQAARRCKEGGLVGLELIAYGHLIDQFWTPRVNDRADQYGRRSDMGLRFFYEVLDEVRRQVGDDFIVGIRMPGDEKAEGGLGRADLIDIAKRVVKTGGIDFVNIVEGYLQTDEAISHVIPVMGTPLGPHLTLAGAVKSELDVPVFNAARITDLDTARHAIESGLVDMVGMVRAHMADPHIVAKLERGESHRIRTCVGASYCVNRIYLGLGAVCIQNPSTGREETIPQLIEPTTGATKKIVVVGGGVAGMEAARVSAERGHEVLLLEAGHELGGQLRLAVRATDRRKELIGIVDWLAAELGHLGVEVLLNTLATAADVTDLSADVVIIATGGTPRLPPIRDGVDLVTSSWDILSGAVTPAPNVIFYDDHGDERGMSVAEFIARAGSQVEIVSPDRYVGHDVIGTNYPSFLRALYEHDVSLSPDLRLRSIEQDGERLIATFFNEYTKTSVAKATDQVVVEHGTAPLAQVYLDLVDGSTNLGEVDLDALIDVRPQQVRSNLEGSYELFRIGDALASRNIAAAFYDARRLTMVL